MTLKNAKLDYSIVSMQLLSTIYDQPTTSTANQPAVTEYSSLYILVSKQTATSSSNDPEISTKLHYELLRYDLNALDKEAVTVTKATKCFLDSLTFDQRGSKNLENSGKLCTATVVVYKK